MEDFHHHRGGVSRRTHLQTIVRTLAIVGYDLIHLVLQIFADGRKVGN
jgi:hypothetical protein